MTQASPANTASVSAVTNACTHKGRRRLQRISDDKG